MPLWDESYTAPSGLHCNVKHDRPPIYSTSVIRLDISAEKGGHSISITCENPEIDDSGEPREHATALTSEEVEIVGRLMRFLRVETAKAVVMEAETDMDEDKDGNKDREHTKTEQVQEGLLWIVRALQVRMNQHWHITGMGREVGLEELVGLLSVREEEKAEDLLGRLMASLAVVDHRDGGEVMEMDMRRGSEGEVVERDGDGGVVVSEVGGGAGNAPVAGDRGLHWTEGKWLRRMNVPSWLEGRKQDAAGQMDPGMVLLRTEEGEDGGRDEVS
jgi:hypothetical protein